MFLRAESCLRFLQTSIPHPLQGLRSERDRFTALMDKAQGEISDAIFVTAKKILELAKNAKELWFKRTMEERRDFLEKILSNRVFDYPSVRYEMKKPFRILSAMALSSNWPRLLDEFEPVVLRWLQQRKNCNLKYVIHRPHCDSLCDF